MTALMFPEPDSTGITLFVEGERPFWSGSLPGN